MEFDCPWAGRSIIATLDASRDRSVGAVFSPGRCSPNLTASSTNVGPQSAGCWPSVGGLFGTCSALVRRLSVNDSVNGGCSFAELRESWSIVVTIRFGVMNSTPMNSTTKSSTPSKRRSRTPIRTSYDRTILPDREDAHPLESTSDLPNCQRTPARRTSNGGHKAAFVMGRALLCGGVPTAARLVVARSPDRPTRHR